VHCQIGFLFRPLSNAQRTASMIRRGQMPDLHTFEYDLPHSSNTWSRPRKTKKDKKTRKQDTVRDRKRGKAFPARFMFFSFEKRPKNSFANWTCFAVEMKSLYPNSICLRNQNLSMRLCFVLAIEKKMALRFSFVLSWHRKSGLAISFVLFW